MANESSELVAKKTAYAISKGMNVIACIGETLEEREAGKTLDVCKEQLAPIVAALSAESWAKVVLAYEPGECFYVATTLPIQQSRSG